MDLRQVCCEQGEELLAGSKSRRRVDSDAEGGRKRPLRNVKKTGKN
jgi:hypothetical protein